MRTSGSAVSLVRRSASSASLSESVTVGSNRYLSTARSYDATDPGNGSPSESYKSTEMLLLLSLLLSSLKLSESTLVSSNYVSAISLRCLRYRCNEKVPAATSRVKGYPRNILTVGKVHCWGELQINRFSLLICQFWWVGLSAIV